MSDKRCHDCGVKEGEIHHYGCDMERCPFCERQLLSCSCIYDELGYSFDHGKKDCGLPEDVYLHGVSKEEEQKFEKILNKKGRIPYLSIPLLCALCGVKWPEFFHDPDWNFYIIPQLQKKILCKKCFEGQKKLFPNGWKQRSNK